MNIELLIKESVIEIIKELYQADINISSLQINKTRKGFDGDYSVNVFPYLRISKKTPEITAKEIGDKLLTNVSEIDNYNVIKGFLNIKVSPSYWIKFINNIKDSTKFGSVEKTSDSESIMIEFSSPNTNKPLHLGHIRNNLLGESISRILLANGKNVTKVNLINDRGIHICKSMLAWQKWGNNTNPDSENLKGDKFVGNFYVKFDVEYKKEIQELITKGSTEKEAKIKAPLLIEAQEMLRRWESGDDEIISLWKKMNDWVYAGFEKTYKLLDVTFDKVYYESNTYKSGKKIVVAGVENKILEKKEDGSIWADLTKNKLDEKLLLRSDGTSVYMTQDIGTAVQRFSEYNIDKHIYIVGNEQNYHFQVLKIVLEKLGYDWAKNILHLSYGMVELPEGKMKSREGTVVDADDLIYGMIDTSTKISKELGKLEDLSQKEAEDTYRQIALAALKYFILKVDPKKNMTFNPKESIDFNGNTGPFIQYTYARICSIFRKIESLEIDKPTHLIENTKIDEKELDLIKLIHSYPAIIADAGKNTSPALIANYVYDLVKEFNQFYHDFSIIKEDDKNKQNVRLVMADISRNIIKNAMFLLGIEVPARM